MADPTKAIFLSYAREDADAAHRIAEALRGFGLEVWFDQSELRGGDQWDQKIRGQIKACALFIPVISATTQSRDEAYFRLEWKLADDRSHLMAAGKTFIVPVVIDDTPEAGAVVPDSFSRSQWTRLPGGEPATAFIEQVKRLLDAPRKPALKPDLPRPPTLPPEFKQAAQAKAAAEAAAKAKPAVPGWMWGVLAAVLVAVGVGVMFLRRPEPVVPPPAPVTVATPKPAPAAPALSDKSIAVLPFTNMSEDKESGFFADGVHEDILTNLALVRELRVVSRTSVMPYRTTTKSMRQIAQELGVAYILEGSVRRSGNKVRVTGQLIHAATDEHVWAQAYDRDLTDIFTIQAELSAQIAGALKAALSPEEKVLLARRPTENLAAYDAYVKARQMALSGTTQLLESRTIESLLKQAVTLDPRFAAAWGELGRQIVFLYFNELDRSPQRLAEAKAAIETAVRLAPDAPEVIESYGDYFYYGYRDYVRAGEQYERLAVLRPNDASVFGSLGLIHRRQGRFKEGLAELQRAVEIEPRNLRYLRTLQQLMQGLDRYDEAAALQRRVIDLTPGDPIEEANLVQIPFFARGSTKECTDLLTQTKPKTAGEVSIVNFGRKQWAVQIGDWTEAIRLDGVERYFENPSFPHWGQDLTMAFALAAHGDQAAARVRAEAALPAVQADLENKPSATAWDALAGIYVLTDRKNEALRAARRAMELVPEAGDAVAGPGISLVYASTLAWTGDKEAALAELARLLRTPFGENIYSAKSSPLWLPLHGDPRFEALLNDPKNNAPLF
ncbi:TIR domain-containing protein [Opitutus sp. GAS368]|uniref:TIR domain-containing protein n=1 Tax=Opitutus sp. GAS368 TaxID=1882749 RepID=UPI00087C6133|nr:TIR domain-containing protein [Opitutus sp. GAS368]SDR83303.1 TolB amino-terminal domain-containing protein [Opitutus sp. GAS368]